jgi:hypothetical protein
MKRIITLMFSLFLVVSAFAVANPSRLSVTSFSSAILTVEVDGNRYERVPGSLIINDLAAGYHKVKVYEVRTERRGFRKVDNYNLIYSSSLLLKPLQHINIAISPTGKVKISEEMIRRNGNDRDDWGRNYPRNDHDWHDRDRGGRDGRGYNQPMSDRMFATAKETIRRETFDKDKLMVAKQIVSNNMFSSSQVRELIQLLSFDDSKLELAKFAYARTFDRNNYFILYDAFAFRKSKEELINYTQHNNRW